MNLHRSGVSAERRNFEIEKCGGLPTRRYARKISLPESKLRSYFVLKTNLMTAPQKTLVIATMFAAVGLVFYEANQAATLRTQVQSLQRQQAFMSAENRQLHFERHDDVSLRTWFFSPPTQPSQLATIAGIMNDPNFRAVVHALENRGGFEQLAEPVAVPVSGRRENRMRVSDLEINLIPLATNGSSSTNHNQAQ